MRLRIVETDPIPLKWILVREDTDQAQLARAIRVSRGYVSEICNGHRRASEDLRRRICDYLDLPMALLFGAGYDNRWRRPEVPERVAS